MEVNSLNELMRLYCDKSEKGITFIINDKEEKFLSYKEMFLQAKEVLNELRSSGLDAGDELIFQITDNQSFVKVFWACILGGIIPVPLPVGVGEEQVNKIFKVWKKLKNPYLITITSLLLEYENTSKISGYEEIMIEINAKAILFDNMNGTDKSYHLYEAKSDDIAMIQYSSGSTGDPKGVIITNKMLISNLKNILERAELKGHDKVLSWLPLTHNMGLIATHLFSVFADIDQFIMPTELFLHNPMLWFQKVSDHKPTLLFSPNFGLKYFTSVFQKDYAKGWDLSTVRAIVCGAEPVFKDVCDDFIRILGEFGLKRTSILPAYGMSESCVLITVSKIERDYEYLDIERDCVEIGKKVNEIIESSDTENNKKLTVVDVGYAVDRCSVRICDDEDRIVDENIVGHIQIKGDNVTVGYYNDVEQSKDLFTKDGWLRTGDVGILRKNHLFITGRAKEIIFINGKNYYPYDIERIAEGSKMVYPNTTVACGVYNNLTGTDEIVLFIQSDKTIEDFVTIAVNLRKYLSRYIGLEISKVIPMKHLPRTSGGKIQRFKLIKMYEENLIQPVLEEMEKYMLSEKHNTVIISEPKTEMEKKLLDLCNQVLETNMVNLNEGFIENGGSSLKASILASKIHKELGMKISLRELLKIATLKELAHCIESKEKSCFDSIEKVDVREYYPLSSAQKRLFVLNKMDQDSTNYNLPMAMILKGKVDKHKIQTAFQVLVNRHESLRTSFELINGDPVQKIHNNLNFRVDYVVAKESEVDSIINNDIMPFDLSQAPLMRVKLIEMECNKYVLFIDIHHIITDGTSMGVLRDEFLSIYEESNLKPIELQYKDYAIWQNRLLESDELKKQEEYWLNQFNGEEIVLNMPTDYPRPSIQSLEGERIKFVLDSELTSGLHKLVKNTSSTMFMVFLAAYNILLNKYTGQKDIIVGSPIAGRTNIELQGLIGMFVNTLALLNQPDGDKTFLEFLKEVNENALNAYENQDYQFEKLVEKLNLTKDLSKNPLFDTMLILQSVSNDNISARDFDIIPYNIDIKTSMFDITLEIVEKQNGFECSIEYCTKLYKRKTIERLSEHFINILKIITENSQIKLSDIDILTNNERKIVLEDFNDTNLGYDNQMTIHALFEQQAVKTPNKIALVYNDKQITYDELNRKSNILARRLIKEGVCCETMVGIIGERSPEIIIGVLAILKAGGAFVPLNSTYPKENLNYMLQDGKVSLLLKYKYDLNLSIPEINLEEPDLFKGDDTGIDIIGTGSNLLYAIYTSGTTGKPKGAMIEHKNIINLIMFEFLKTNIDFDNRVLQFTTMSFDVCYQEIFSTLLHGGELYIIDEDSKKDVSVLFEFIKRNEINTVFLPTSFLKFIMNDEKYCNEIPLCIKHMITAGEQLIISKQFIEFFENSGIYLHNHYGPSETHVVTTKTMYGTDIQHIPTIGRPISNTEIYILNNMIPQGIGIPGELYISGESVGRGYLNNEELTQNKFVSNPFRSNRRMYRTGDLARWLDDGSIEFMGRMDHQVKIRGFRIEIGGIETQLIKHTSIKDATVIVKKDKQGNNYLCAYVVCNEKISDKEIKDYLSLELPDYMIPSFIIQLEEIPLTSHGKVNRRFLPEPVISNKLNQEYCPPESELENDIGKIWMEVLGAEQIDVNSNFFEQGGHSLKAATLVSKINTKIGVDVPLKEVFKHPTIRDIAKYINNFGNSKNQEIEVLPKTQYYPVSSTQRRILILSKIEDIGIQYNMPGVMTLEGAIDLSAVKKAFNLIIKRHEILRTTFDFISNEPVQKVHDNLELDIECKDIQENETEEMIMEFVKPFELNKLPLMRVEILKLRNDKHILLVDFHHIVLDGVSINMLLNEFTLAYEGKDLPKLKVQYKDFSVWHNKFLKSDTVKKQEKYWNKKLNNFVYTELPKDSIINHTDSIGASIKALLGKELTEKINDYCSHNGITKFMFHITILNIIISKEINQQDLSIAIPVENRRVQELENMIGLFLNVLLIRSNISTSKTFRDYLYEIKNIVIEALDNQDYPYDDLYAKIKQNTGFGMKNLFSILFNYMPFDNNKELNFSGITLKPSSDMDIIPKYDLTLYVNEVEDDTLINLVYRQDFYSSYRMERILNNFRTLCDNVVKNDAIRIKDIELIDILSIQDNEFTLSFDDDFDNEDFLLI